MPEPDRSPPTSPPIADAAAELVPIVYAELRRIAAGMMRNARSGGGGAMAPGTLTLQPTALVHEAFIKLESQRCRWVDQTHFRAIASIAMRRVLADHVRARKAARRGEGNRGMTLHTDVLGSSTVFNADALHMALEELEIATPRVAALVIYRFFGDLSVEQAADRLGVSASTAEADWRFARNWLKRRLGEIDA